MSVADLINGAFESFASLFILRHVQVLYKDKMVKGVSSISIAFFFSWGLWNIWYYPHLGQTISFYGGIAVVIANALYLGLVIYYRRKG